MRDITGLRDERVMSNILLGSRGNPLLAFSFPAAMLLGNA
jgi:hypothetical protein